MKIIVKDNNFLQKIPCNSGVYRFLDEEERVLYVGKALDLKKRIKSYFNKSGELSPRISLMVTKICFIEVTLTENEMLALHLENNLIKSLKPKYNIIFRDDKSYPLIRLSKHKFPRIESYRGKVNPHDKSFGPYANSQAVKRSIDIIQKLFKLRTCSDSFFNNRTRACILGQIDRCSAPCVNLINEKDYSKSVNYAESFLKGNYKDILSILTQQMEKFSEQEEYEKAAITRDQISMLHNLGEGDVLANSKLDNNNLLIIKEENNIVHLYIISIISGKYVNDRHLTYKNTGNKITEILESFLTSNYLNINNRNNIKSVLIEKPFFLLLNDDFKLLFKRAFNIKLKSYTKNQNNIKQLYKMGEMNLNKIIDKEYGDFSTSLLDLGQLLSLKNINRIECYDVSHNHADNIIGSMVVFENNKIDNSLYRIFNIPKEMGANDIKSLEYIVNRRLKNTELRVPEVIIVDGGKNQFNRIKNLLVDKHFYDKIRLVGIYKGIGRNPQLDSIIIENIKKGILILKYQGNEKIFKIIQYMRDEAHRFAITRHRKKQVAKMAVSSLDEIENIGVVKKKQLLAYFGSIKNIADAKIEELCLVKGIGLKLANIIYSYFH